MKRQIILQHNNAQPHIEYQVRGKSRHGCEVFFILDLLIPDLGRLWWASNTRTVSIQEAVHTWL